jgi:hypothetical protein
VTFQVRSKPPGCSIVEKALSHLKAFSFVARITLVRKFSIQIIIHLKYKINGKTLTNQVGPNIFFSYSICPFISFFYLDFYILFLFGLFANSWPSASNFKSFSNTLESSEPSEIIEKFNLNGLRLLPVINLSIFSSPKNDFLNVNKTYIGIVNGQKFEL